MGSYDTVIVECPKCGEVVEFQSKAGDCMFNNYSLRSTLTQAPATVLADISNQAEKCSKGHTVRIHVTVIATPYTSPLEDQAEQEYKCPRH